MTSCQYFHLHQNCLSLLKMRILWKYSVTILLLYFVCLTYLGENKPSYLLHVSHQQEQLEQCMCCTAWKEKVEWTCFQVRALFLLSFTEYAFERIGTVWQSFKVPLWLSFLKVTLQNVKTSHWSGRCVPFLMATPSSCGRMLCTRKNVHRCTQMLCTRKNLVPCVFQASQPQHKGQEYALLGVWGSQWVFPAWDVSQETIFWDWILPNRCAEPYQAQEELTRAAGCHGAGCCHVLCSAAPGPIRPLGELWRRTQCPPLAWEWRSERMQGLIYVTALRVKQQVTKGHSIERRKILTEC